MPCSCPRCACAGSVRSMVGDGGDVGRVALIMRYPVKSTAGESLEAADVHARGVVGDRAWATYTPDGGIGSCKTTRRFRRVDGLMEIASALGEDHVPLLEFDDAVRLRVDDDRAGELLTARLRTPVELRPETDVPHHDEAPIHLVTTAAIRALERLLGETVEPVRFRPNLVIDVPGEDAPDERWRGRDVAIGEDVVLRISGTMPRCRMVGLAQRGLGPRPGLLRRITAVQGVDFGLQATVVRPGQLVRGARAVLI